MDNILEQQQPLKDLIQEYVEIAWRRKFCLLPFPFLAVLVIYYVMSMPPVYQSEGVLLVEDQNIPPELIRTTVTSYAAEQMQVIRQQLQSTENVTGIIKKIGLYNNAEGADPVALAQRFRNNMRVDTINADILDPEGGRRRIVSIAFRVSFRDESPQLAQAVAEELIDLFLERNASTRTEEAARTSAFLRDEAEVLKQRVIGLEDRIAEFKSINAGSLPELLEYNLETIAGSEERIRDNQLSVDNLSEQEQLLSIELRAMDPYTGLALGSATDATNPGPMNAAAILSQRKAELAQLSTRYSASHPTILGLKREIQTIEEQLAAAEPSDSVISASDDEMLSPVYLNLRYRVGSIQRDIQSLLEENNSLKAQVEEYNQRVANTYIVEREYEELQRDHLASSARYEQLRNAQYEAEVAQSLEEKNQVESLTIIETPKVPRSAVGPDRKKYLVLGFGFAGALCLGLGVVLEFFDERVRGLRGFQRIVGEPPLVLVRNIQTKEDLEHARRQKIKLILLAAFGIIFLLALLILQLFFIDFRALI